ncbi:MAG: hypothetical protein MdMp024_0023 [Bacteroidales bacterium]
MRPVRIKTAVSSLAPETLSGEFNSGVLVHDRLNRTVKTFNVLPACFKAYGVPYANGVFLSGWCEFYFPLPVESRSFDWYLFTGLDEHTVIDPFLPLETHSEDREVLNADGYILLNGNIDGSLKESMLVKSDLLSDDRPNPGLMRRVRCLARGHRDILRERTWINDVDTFKSLRLQ